MRIIWPRNKSVLFLITLTVLSIGTPAFAQQQDMLKFRVTTGAVSINRVINWVAVGEGLYKKNGLDVEQCLTRGDQRDLKRFWGIEAPPQHVCTPEQEMNIPITIGGGTPNMINQMVNPDAQRRVIIGTVQNRTNYQIIGRKGLVNPEDLKGKKIGYTGNYNTSHFQVVLFAKAMGWEIGKDLFPVLEPNDDLNGFETGKLDAFLAQEPGIWLAAQAGYKPIVDMMTWNVPMASSSFNADRTWLRDNRETARRFMKSVVEAIAMMKKDKRVAFRALATYYNIKDPKLQQFFYDQMANFPAKPYPAVEGLRNSMVMFDSVEVRRHRVEDFVDDSFVRELDESGYIDSLYKK